VLRRIPAPSQPKSVDAFVGATALEFDTSLIATGDTKDIRRLSARYPRISLMQL
jgi:hypothetical protein